METERTDTMKRLFAYCVLCGERYLKQYLGEQNHECVESQSLNSMPAKDQS